MTGKETGYRRDEEEQGPMINAPKIFAWVQFMNYTYCDVLNR
jgi:hypothetical protein